MAIQKTKVLPNGVSGNYWRITAIKIDLMRLSEPFQTTFTIALFVDKAASDAGKTPIFSKKQYTFEFTRTELISGAIAAIGQQKILDKASSMVDPLFGIGSAHAFDSDLSDGEIVT
jgi:hypothetical protein